RPYFLEIPLPPTCDAILFPEEESRVPSLRTTRSKNYPPVESFYVSTHRHCGVFGGGSGFVLPDPVSGRRAVLGAVWASRDLDAHALLCRLHGCNRAARLARRRRNHAVFGEQAQEGRF